MAKILSEQLSDLADILLSQRKVSKALRMTKLFKQGKQTELLQKILQKCVEQGWLKEALETTSQDFLNRQLTEEELLTIILKCAENGWDADLLAAIEKIPTESLKMGLSSVFKEKKEASGQSQPKTTQ